MAGRMVCKKGYKYIVPLYYKGLEKKTSRHMEHCYHTKIIATGIN
jgi:hypothetical protein